MATYYYNGATGAYLGTKKPSALTATNVIASGMKPVNGRIPSNWNAAATPRYQGSGAPNLYQKRYGEATSFLDSLSGQQMDDLRSRYGAARGYAMNSLAGQGLMASTILPSMMTGINRAQSADENLLNDQLARERLGVMGEFTAGQAGAMQSDAAARNAFALNQQQMLQQSAMDSARLAQYGSRYGVATSAPARGGISSRFTGRTYSNPGSYSAYQARYARS